MTAHPRLFDSAHWLAAVGLVLVITLTALEAMAVATVMPVTVRELHGLRFYGWAFTAFFLADVIGIVDSGTRTDRTGPVKPLLGGLLLFAAGLFVAGLANNMLVFVAGRAVQGLGGGSLIVAVYVVVARAFPEELRPKAFAALSAAWVVPALVGPAAAGAVADAFGWRWVFLGIVPFVLVGTVLLLPVLRDLPVGDRKEPTLRRGTSMSGVRLAIGLALLQASGQRLAWWTVPLAAAGLVLLLPPLRALLPAGALRLARGLPSVVVFRGLLAAAFFGAEAFLPLTLSVVHGFSPTAVGIPLTFGAVGWSAASWLQGRRPADVARVPLLRRGFLFVALAVGLLAMLAASPVNGWVALALWGLGGAGMGWAYPSISVLTLGMSPEAEQGANSAALQISDVVGSVVGVAAAGSLVALLQPAHFSTAIVVVDLVLAGVAIFGMLMAGRAEPASPSPAADHGQSNVIPA